MKDGYLIKLNDGTEIEAVTDDDGKFKFHIGETCITIEDGLVLISGAVADSGFSSEIVLVSSHKVSSPDAQTATTKKIIEVKDDEGIIRRCIICRSRYYCITRGCARTPCGWICG